MRNIAGLIGRVTYWLSWPLLFWYLRGSERSRIIIVAEGKILLIQNWHGPGKWTLPGGGVHKGEEVVLSATRELLEETTIALGKDQLRLLATKPFRENGLGFTCHYFVAELGQVIKATPKLPEILKAEWLDTEEAKDLRLGADTREALALYGVIQ
jgi:8-oxo-dGTP pyrophosphatase MutT (NUDIX family)